MNGLTSYKIVSTVQNIDNTAFLHCPTLKCFESNDYFDVGNCMLFRKGYKTLIRIPESIDYDNNFQSLSNAKIYGSYSFAYFNKNTEINIYDELLTIENNAFYAVSIEKFSISTSNKKFKLDEYGVLFDFNYKYLYYYLWEIKNGESKKTRF